MVFESSTGRYIELGSIGLLGVASVLFSLFQIFTNQICCWLLVFILFAIWLFGFGLCSFFWIIYNEIDLRVWLLKRPVRFFYLALIFSLVVIGYFDIFYLLLPNGDIQLNRVENILVESHGLLFDLFLFGVGITIYDEFRNRRVNIERYSEELEDYRAGLIMKLHLEWRELSRD